MLFFAIRLAQQKLFAFAEQHAIDMNSVASKEWSEFQQLFAGFLNGDSTDFTASSSGGTADVTTDDRYMNTETPASGDTGNASSNGDTHANNSTPVSPTDCELALFTVFNSLQQSHSQATHAAARVAPMREDADVTGATLLHKGDHSNGDVAQLTRASTDNREQATASPPPVDSSSSTGSQPVSASKPKKRAYVK